MTSKEQPRPASHAQAQKKNNGAEQETDAAPGVSAIRPAIAPRAHWPACDHCVTVLDRHAMQPVINCDVTLNLHPLLRRGPRHGTGTGAHASSRLIVVGATTHSVWACCAQNKSSAALSDVAEIAVIMMAHEKAAGHVSVPSPYEN